MPATPDPEMSAGASATRSVESSDSAAFTYPLSDFYAMAGLPLPQIESIDGEVVPEPCKSLLVHRDDMTPTLEAFHESTIHIRAMSRKEKNGFYFREVLLLLDGSDRPVEFGAIKIDLRRFAPEPRRFSARRNVRRDG